MELVRKNLSQKTATGVSESQADHIRVLDGWRAISILLVLACHLLPLGPRAWQLNDAAGPAGMALFFTLSGFLITKYLLDVGNLKVFFVRRLLRIVPLAWLGLLIALPWAGKDTPEDWFWNLSFLANVPPIHLSDLNAHYWSLCVEVQFYIGIALLFGLFGIRGLYILLPLCFLVTANRVYFVSYVDIATFRRIDEILVGSVLAMCAGGKYGEQVLSWLNARGSLFFLVLALLFAVSCHPQSGAMNYARPYLAASLVATSMYACPVALRGILESRLFTYIASISFALYVVHPLVNNTYLGFDEDKLIKYAKRVIVIAVTFLLAHFSTQYFEKFFIVLGRRLSKQLMMGSNTKPS